jgi:hypothetical protein
MANGFLSNAFEGVGGFARDLIGAAGQVFVAKTEGEARAVEAQQSANVLNQQTMVQNQQFQLMVLAGIAGLVLFLTLKKR